MEVDRDVILAVSVTYRPTFFVYQHLTVKTSLDFFVCLFLLGNYATSFF